MYTHIPCIVCIYKYRHVLYYVEMLVLYISRIPYSRLKVEVSETLQTYHIDMFLQ